MYVCEWIKHFVHTIVINEYVNKMLMCCGYQWIGCVVATNGLGVLFLPVPKTLISKSWCVVVVNVLGKLWLLSKNWCVVAANILSKL
jgi:hypothetical protein